MMANIKKKKFTLSFCYFSYFLLYLDHNIQSSESFCRDKQIIINIIQLYLELLTSYKIICMKKVADIGL